MEENPSQATTTSEFKRDDDEEDKTDPRATSSRSRIASALLEKANAEKDVKNENNENKKVERVVELFKRKNEQPVTESLESTTEFEKLPVDTGAAMEDTSSESSLDVAGPSEVTAEGTIQETENSLQTTRERVEAGFRTDYVFTPEVNELRKGDVYRGEAILEREIDLREPSETEVDLRGQPDIQTSITPQESSSESSTALSNTSEILSAIENASEVVEQEESAVAAQTTEISAPVPETLFETNATESDSRQPYVDSPPQATSPTWYGPNVDSTRTYQTPNVAAASFENPISPEALQKETDAAHQRGARKGLITGLLVGGGYEHFKHSRQEKKMAKNHTKELRNQAKNLTNEIQQQQIDQTNTVAHTESAQSVFEQQAIAAINKAPTSQEQPVPPQRAPVERAHTTRRFANAHGPERAIATTTAMERFRNAQAEKGFTARLEKLLPKRSERKPITEANSQDEQLRVPAEHRLQSSAWHAIEVDAKTGKPVENGTFQYGQEYYRERAHEVSEPNDTRDTAAGEVALVAAAMAVNNTDNRPVASLGAQHGSGQANQQDVLISQAPKRTLSTVKDKTNQAFKQSLQSSGPIWPFIVAFAVVVILLILAFS